MPTTFKPVIYADNKRQDGTYNVKIRVTHRRQTLKLSTNMYVAAHQMTRALKLKDQSIIDEAKRIIDNWRAIVGRLGAAADVMTVRQVVDYINEKYDGSVVSTVDTPTDGFDATVDYDALAGETISIAASPTPHAEILEVVKEILAEKNITLDIQVYNDYVVPNTVVEDGTVDANYFQHKPYLDDFNAENNTHIVSVAAIHVEPMGLYGGKQTTLDALSAK